MYNKTVFIAEGEKHVLKALQLSLANQTDFIIQGEAGHAESLLAQVCAQPPDVILLDWNLPGINPQRLIQTLRKHCPAAVLVATSVKPEHEKYAEDYGMDGFLSKQGSPDEFMEELKAITNRS